MIKRILIGIVVIVVVVIALLVAFPMIRLATWTTVPFDLSQVEVPASTSPEAVAQNKEIARKFYLQLYSADYEAAIASLPDDYVEHQITANFSKAGLSDYVAQQLNTYPELEMVIHRELGRGDLVFFHVEEKLNAIDSVARGEMFRIRDGVIVEHWASEQVVPKEANNDNTMFGGPPTNTVSTAGEVYLEQVLSSYFDAFVNANPQIARETTTERYIQHSPGGQDGIESFVALLEQIQFVKGYGFDTEIDIKISFAEGDYIIMLTHYNTPVFQPHRNVFDMYRVTEDGLKDEHWDVIEAIENPDDIDRIF